MNYFKLIVVGIVGFILFVGDIHVGEAGGRGRRFVEEPASASGPVPALPIFLYGQEGPVVLNENAQQFVKVHYRYGKDGKIVGAKGKGNFKIDDGFGNISKGTIRQDYKIIDGQAKLVENNTNLNTKHIDGAESKQNLIVQYGYDKNGKLQSAVGNGKLTGDDGFANKTEGKISQTFFIFKEQPKLKDSVQDFETKNRDGSWRSKSLTTAYSYDKTGKLKNVSGRGTFISDDGFGNVTEGKIAQNYQIIKGQAKLAKVNKKTLEVPPPPSVMTKKEEPQIATRHKPQEEPVAGHCARGTWSPTLRTCIEDEPIEEVKPQNCERGSWSPTLKMCVE